MIESIYLSFVLLSLILTIKRVIKFKFHLKKKGYKYKINKYWVLDKVKNFTLLSIFIICPVLNVINFIALMIMENRINDLVKDTLLNEGIIYKPSDKIDFKNNENQKIDQKDFITNKDKIDYLKKTKNDILNYSNKSSNDLLFEEQVEYSKQKKLIK